MACHFHSFHKENTKSVTSHYLRLINNNPDMLNLFSAATKTWGKWTISAHIRASSTARWRAAQPEPSEDGKWSRPPTNSMRCQSGNWPARMTFSSNQARWFLNTEYMNWFVCGVSNKVHILLRMTRRWSVRENKGAAIRLLRRGASQPSSVLLQTRTWLTSLRCLYLLSWQSVRTRPLLS